MSADITKLLATASKAAPPSSKEVDRTKWVRLLPVWDQLRGNGFTREDAAKWMIANKACAGEARKILEAMSTAASRRNARLKKVQAD